MNARRYLINASVSSRFCSSFAMISVSCVNNVSASLWLRGLSIPRKPCSLPFIKMGTAMRLLIPCRFSICGVIPSLQFPLSISVSISKSFFARNIWYHSENLLQALHQWSSAWRRLGQMPQLSVKIGIVRNILNSGCVLNGEKQLYSHYAASMVNV